MSKALFEHVELCCEDSKFLQNAHRAKKVLKEKTCLHSNTVVFQNET